MQTVTTIVLVHYYFDHHLAWSMNSIRLACRWSSLHWPVTTTTTTTTWANWIESFFSEGSPVLMFFIVLQAHSCIHLCSSDTLKARQNSCQLGRCWWPVFILFFSYFWWQLLSTSFSQAWGGVLQSKSLTAWSVFIFILLYYQFTALFCCNFQFCAL